MTPTEIAALLGDIGRGDAVLAGIPKRADPVLATAIRASFQPGDEQGNVRRLRALVRLEGDGALDVVTAVLTDTETTGGIYSNLRNAAFRLIAKHYPGRPTLVEPVWRAVEIDPYLDIQYLYPVAAAYDAARALALLVPHAERGFGPALQLLAAADRPQLVALLDAALAAGGDTADRFVEGLWKVALEPDLAVRIVPHAAAVPSAAVVALGVEPARGAELADHITSKDARWQRVGVLAVATLPPAAVFDRVSPWLQADDRGKPAMRSRIEKATRSPELALVDPRWPAFLANRLEVEDNAKLRELLVYALANTGEAGLDALLVAPRDDQDAPVLRALPFALASMRRHPIADRVRAAVAAASKGKRKKALERALTALES